MSEIARHGAGSAMGMSNRRRSLAFITVLVAVVLEVVDTTIVNTAIPLIRTSLDASPTAMQWIVAGYLLSLGSLLLLGGRLGDALGHSRVFLIGVAGFVVTSLLCGLARDPQELVIARLLQGASGAIMAPQSMAIIQLLYTPLERVKQLAYFGVILGLAAILGPIVGGILIELNLLGLGWRVIFLINLPIGLFSITLGWFVLPDAETKAELRIDPLGALVFCGAFGALLYGLIEGSESGWRPELLALMAVGTVLAASGWARARRRLAAKLPTIVRPDLFRIGTFRWATAASLGFSAGSIGFLLVFALALQTGLGLTPLETALVHIPFGAGVMLGVGFIVPRLLPRIGRKLPTAGGSLMLASTVAVMLLIRGGNGGNVILLMVLMLAGVGMGCLQGPLGPIVVAEVPRELAGTASATFRTSQQVGGALGIALVGGAYFALGGTIEPALQGLLPAALVVACLLALSVVSVSLLPARLFAQED